MSHGGHQPHQPKAQILQWGSHRGSVPSMEQESAWFLRAGLLEYSTLMFNETDQRYGYLSGGQGCKGSPTPSSSADGCNQSRRGHQRSDGDRYVHQSTPESSLVVLAEVVQPQQGCRRRRHHGHPVPQALQLRRPYLGRGCDKSAPEVTPAAAPGSCDSEELHRRLMIFMPASTKAATDSPYTRCPATPRRWLTRGYFCGGGVRPSNGFPSSSTSTDIDRPVAAPAPKGLIPIRRRATR